LFCGHIAVEQVARQTAFVVQDEGPTTLQRCRLLLHTVRLAGVVPGTSEVAKGRTVGKVDFKKTLSKLYSAPIGRFAAVDVPALQFFKIDGNGDPNREPAYAQVVEWLYSVSYAMKFASKSGSGRDYVVPPLEGLWWADDPADFVNRRKHRWKWTMMIMVPDFASRPLYDDAITKTQGKRGEPPPETLRLESLEEGRSLQTLHVGSYDDEGPILARLHNEVMPAEGLTFAGPHHEIYLSDPRKTAPEKLKTILRQPIRRAD